MKKTKKKKKSNSNNNSKNNNSNNNGYYYNDYYYFIIIIDNNSNTNKMRAIATFISELYSEEKNFCFPEEKKHTYSRIFITHVSLHDLFKDQMRFHFPCKLRTR